MSTIRFSVSALFLMSVLMGCTETENRRHNRPSPADDDQDSTLVAGAEAPLFDERGAYRSESPTTITARGDVSSRA